MRASSACICSTELGVGDGRELRAGLGALAFLRLERDDRAAEPRAGDELMDGLDGGDDRLLILDLDRVDDEFDRAARAA